MSGRIVNWASRNEQYILGGVQIANWAPAFINAARNTYNGVDYVLTGFKRDRKGNPIEDPMDQIEGEETQPVPDPVEIPVVEPDVDMKDAVIEAPPEVKPQPVPMVLADSYRTTGGGPRNVAFAKLDSRRRLSRIVTAREA